MATVTSADTLAKHVNMQQTMATAGLQRVYSIN